MAALQVQRLASPAPSDRLDPCLQVARATGWRGLQPAAGSPAEAPRWPVSIELDPGAALPAIGAGLVARAAHAGSRFVTAEADEAAIDALLARGEVGRVLLAAAMAPARARPAPMAAGVTDEAADPTEDARAGDTLLGVIDNGCPFAHPDLLRADSRTRVLRLWNQQASPLAARAPDGFGYGVELSRADLQRLMAAHATATGRPDAAALYRAAGLGSLLRRHSHGAHVLGLLAAQRHWFPSTRADPRLRERQRGNIAATADIAFVQLPQHLVDAVSVAHLEHQAVDALRYLVMLALGQGYRRLGVVFAYESRVGPHDGQDWFSHAVDALFDEVDGRLDLDLFTIAGNGRARAAHAVLDGPRSALRWQLPPGNEQACWLELWPANGDWKTPPRLRLTSPSGRHSGWLDWGGSWRLAGGGRTQATLVTVERSARSPGRPLALLRLEPTAAQGGLAAAAHGLWTLEVEPGPGEGAVPRIDARLGRLEPDPQAPLRARSAHFVGRSTAESIADSLGTLNGHAFGRRMTVVGAFQSDRFPYLQAPGVDARGRPGPLYTGAGLHPMLRQAPAAYSGAAAQPGSPFRPRWSIPVDDGILRAGTLGPGNTAGAVTRLSGTSAAAPLVAARWADGPLPASRAPAANPALGSRLGR